MRSQLKKLRHRSYNLRAHYKIILFLIILIIINLLPKNLYGDEFINCKLNNNQKIDKIEIEIYKNKKWIENNIKILISNTRTIPKKLRKRFKGQVVVNYIDGSRCILKAKIRQNGDFKDHFNYKNNSIKQSLNVQLSNGNLGNIISFKLLLDGTRGNSEDEIFLTELLRELNFISPRSQMIKVRVNNLNAIMLFQENAKKELLEYNGRIESPIYESNENDYFKFLEKFENNNLTNDEIGFNHSLNQAIMGLLARQTNAKWASRSATHSKISFDALSDLNLVYMNSVKSIKDDQFDNTLLGNQNKQNIINLEKYNLILKAVNGEHALISHNRKFYWNKIERYFEPIYYDGNVNIIRNDNIKLNLPANNHIKVALNELEISLKNLDFKKFRKNLNIRGLKFTEKDIEKKLSIIFYNLSKLRAEIKSLSSESLNSNEKLNTNNNIIKGVIKNKKKNNPQSVFIFKKEKQKNEFLICKNFDECKNIKIKKSDQIKLISGELIKNNQEYIYLGYYPYLKTKIKDNEFYLKKFTEYNINFYFNDGIEFKFDKNKEELNIFQTKPEARAYFFKSDLKNLNINFQGYKNFDNLKFFPFDFRGLTGCLTFYKSKFNNVNLKFENSNCEDSINMINVSGEINDIFIKNSYSDSLDIDFSKINIKRIEVQNSGNDCVDVSFGKYNFGKLDLDKCQDKGLSVGETSKIFVKDIKINNSSVGIASKDGSIANFLKSNINNVNTCLESYNKKQEFSGGYIKVDNFNCSNFIKQLSFDSQSKIILEN